MVGSSTPIIMCRIYIPTFPHPSPCIPIHTTMHHPDPFPALTPLPLTAVCHHGPRDTPCQSGIVVALRAMHCLPLFPTILPIPHLTFLLSPSG